MFWKFYSSKIFKIFLKISSHEGSSWGQSFFLGFSIVWELLFARHYASYYTYV